MDYGILTMLYTTHYKFVCTLRLHSLCSLFHVLCVYNLYRAVACYNNIIITYNNSLFFKYVVE